LICLEHIWKDIKTGFDEIKGKHPNFVDIAAHEVLLPVNAKSVADPIPAAKFWNKAAKASVPLLEKRKKLRVGIPRAQHLHLCAALQWVPGGTRNGGRLIVTPEHMPRPRARVFNIWAN